MRICWRKRTRSRWGTDCRPAGARRTGAVVALALLVGCAAPPPAFVPLRTDNLKIVHCFDGIGHQAGSKPWILGGTCCCTPTDELMRAYQPDGFCVGMTTDDLIQLYRAKGIVLAHDHVLCNNLCQDGPHVTQGGRCMAPPTPGTRQFERVVTGQGGPALADQRSRPGKKGVTP